MELPEIRNKLDELDHRLIALLAERMSVIPSVAECKIKHNLPRYQPEREKTMIERIRNLASNLNLNPNLGENIIKLIIADAHRIEEEMMNR